MLPRRLFFSILIVVTLIVGFTGSANAQGPQPTITPTEDPNRVKLVHQETSKNNDEIPMFTVNKEVTPETTQKTPMKDHIFLLPADVVSLGCLKGDQGELWFYTKNPTIRMHLKNAGFLKVTFTADIPFPVVIVIKKAEESLVEGCYGPAEKQSDSDHPVTTAGLIVIGKLYPDGKAELFEGDVDVILAWRNDRSKQVIPMSGDITIQACSTTCS